MRMTLIQIIAIGMAFLAPNGIAWSSSLLSPSDMLACRGGCGCSSGNSNEGSCRCMTTGTKCNDTWCWQYYCIRCTNPQTNVKQCIWQAGLGENYYCVTGGSAYACGYRYKDATCTKRVGNYRKCQGGTPSDFACGLYPPEEPSSSPCPGMP